MRSGRQLIADDLVLVRKQEPNVLIGQALEENVRIEVRGLGLFNARTLFDDAVEESCPIDIVVELTSYIPERDAGLVSPVVSQTTIMGCSLDKFLIPVATGMDPGFLIELLVRSKS